MPYIKYEKREALEDFTYECFETLEDVDIGAGELNYMITQLLHSWLRKNGNNYSNYNLVMGVLSCVAQELYRRVVVPYEDSKMEENGDVYD